MGRFQTSFVEPPTTSPLTTTHFYNFITRKVSPIMCDPVSISIISLGLTATSAISSYVGQRNDAQRIQAENTAYYNANKQAAINAAVLNDHELTLRQSEELLATAVQQHDVQAQVSNAASTAKVAAAEAGLSGNSIDAVINDVRNQGSLELGRLQENSELQQAQLQRQKDAALVEAQNNINTVRQVDVRQPSLLTPILQIGGGALSAADQYLSRSSRGGGGSVGSGNGGVPVVHYEVAPPTYAPKNYKIDPKTGDVTLNWPKP
jgi:hypothetical protein